MVGDIIDYLIFFVGTLGAFTIIFNAAILYKLGKSSLRRFGLQVMGLIIIFFIAGFLRSYQAFFENEYSEILLVIEYSIYSITYIAAYYTLYKMTETYGFNVD